MSQHLNIYVARNADGYTLTINGCIAGHFVTAEECCATIMRDVEALDFSGTRVSINNIAVATLEKATILLRSIR